MSATLAAQLQRYLETLTTLTGNTAQFAMDQAPLLIQEKLAYARIAEPLLLAGSLVLTISSLYALAWSIRVLKTTKYSDDEGTAIAVLFIGTIGTLVFSVLSVFQTGTVIQVYTAPRLYIIQWIFGLLKH